MTQTSCAEIAQLEKEVAQNKKQVLERLNWVRTGLKSISWAEMPFVALYLYASLEGMGHSTPTDGAESDKRR